jgi:NADPH:quinone reductase-like Zn-dependent oxidoreductase
MLVQAGAGGVGHYAIQLAKRLGAYVIATSSAANKDFVMSMGADEHIDYHAVKFEDVVRDVDIVFDAVGGEIVDRSLNVVKPGGIVVSIPSGLKEGTTAKAAQLGVNAYFQLVKSSGGDMQELAALLESGKLISHVSQVFSFDEMLKAHEQIESGRTRGKVVVKL